MERSVLWAQARAWRQDLISFAQRLVQTPSPSGSEGNLAALIVAEMQQLGYDEVRIDGVGNVIGRIAGGDGPSLMLNGHMDHVDAHSDDRWPHPPFAGEIHGNELWGRGAADMKGALAAMVYAGGLIKFLGRQPPGEVYVAGVVQEEVGGLGTRHLAQTLAIDRAIIGEASNNHLRRGHRGRVELVARFLGQSVHASMPDLSINPHYSLARFVGGLHSLAMATDPDYGHSTVAPTRIVSLPQSANVTPAEVRLVLDWRNVPSEKPEQIVAKLEALLAQSLEAGCQGEIEIASKDLVSYTGFSMSYPDNFPSFSTNAAHPWLLQARQILATALEREIEVGTWRFATDGGHLAAAGTTVIGFGPGDEALVHTIEERIPLEHLVECMVGYVALCLAQVSRSFRPTSGEENSIVRDG